MQSITFFLDFPLPTLNEMIQTARGNKFAAAAQKKKYTNLVAMEIVVQTERPYFEALSLDLTWLETKKKRDPDNVFAAVKFILDGIVSSGIIDDDDRNHVASITNRIVVSNSRGVVVSVTNVPKPLYTITDTYIHAQDAQNKQGDETICPQVQQKKTEFASEIGKTSHSPVHALYAAQPGKTRRATTSGIPNSLTPTQ